MVSVSVVVATYSTERLNDVLDCISSLKRQTFPAADIILVLDPREMLVEYYKSRVPPEVRIVVSHDVGLSHARNAGIENATGEIVAFIDDDAVADEKWLENLVGNYEDLDVLGVGGMIEPMWENGRPGWFPEELYWIVGCSYKGLPESKGIIRNPIGCNMSFRKSIFEKIGYFDTEIGRVGNGLMAHEETEFSIRLLRRNPHCEILYDPEAVVHHKVPRSRANMKYIVIRSFAEGLSKAFFVRHRSNPASVLFVERNYLRRLFSTGILGRLIVANKPRYIFQILTLLLSTSLVVLGYLAGDLRLRLVRTASKTASDRL